MPTKDRRRVDVFGLLAFGTVVALCVLVSFSAGLRAFGIWMVDNPRPIDYLNIPATFIAR